MEKYINKYGLHQFIDKILADVSMEYFHKYCNEIPHEFYTSAKISRAYFYKLMKNAEDFYKKHGEK